MQGDEDREEGASSRREEGPPGGSEELLGEFLSSREAGEQVDPEAYLREHPEFARELNRYFDRLKSDVIRELERDRTDKPGSDGGTATRILGDFKIIRELGRGGMGAVYEAEDISLMRRVALKLIKDDYTQDPVYVKRFQREAEAAGRLTHPGIVQIYSIGEDGGRHYIVQEFVDEGRTLAAELKKLQERRELPEGYYRNTATLFVQIALSLQHAHEHGVIHRDLKPRNILLTREGIPKVTDFGLAQVEGALGLSRTGEQLGTPHYWSPEQASGKLIGRMDLRTDIFSLGITLYEALTMTLPFQGDTTQQVAQAIILDEPKDPRQIRSRVPRDLAVICLKSLEKKREHRYQTMKDFAADLRRFANDEPILAKPPGPVRRTLKWVRRHPVISASGSVLTMALLVITILLVQLNTEKENAFAAKNEAEEARKEKEQQYKKSENLQLALQSFQSSKILPKNPGLALLLAIESAKIKRDLFINNALLDALINCLEHKTLVHYARVIDARFSPKDATALRVITIERPRTVHIWDAESGRKTATLKGQKNYILNARFSPDGEKVVTTYFDADARIWDASTGDLLIVLRGKASEVDDAAFSPDGMWLLTTSRSGAARIWDARTGRGLHTLEGHEHARINSAEFSPAGRRALTASDDKTARIWDTDTGREILTLRGHEGGVISASFNRDALRVATASEDKTARVWNASTGTCELILRGHQAGVLSAEFSPDRRWLLTTSKDRTARVWDTRSGEEIMKFEDEGNGVNAARFSPNGKWLAAAYDDGTARIWDFERGREILAFRGHEKDVLTAAFSGDGGLLVTTSEDRTARIWKVRSHGEVIVALEGHESAVNHAGFSLNDKRVVTASWDGTARIWDSETGEAQKILRGHGDRVRYASFSPDGAMVLTLSEDHTARIWDAEKGNTLFSFDRIGITPVPYTNEGRLWDYSNGTLVTTLKGYKGPVRNARLSINRNRLVTEDQGDVARLWDTATGEEIPALGRYGDIFNAARFSPDGRWIAAALCDNTMNLWDAQRGIPVRSFEGHKDAVYAVHFSPADHRIISASRDGTARIFDVSEEREIARLRGCEGWVTFARFSPDGTRILSATYDVAASKGSADLWDAGTYSKITTLWMDKGWVVDATFSPDGRLLVTAASRGVTPQVWDSRTGLERFRLRGHEREVNSVVFNPEGDLILTASKDGTARLWKSSDGEEIITFGGHDNIVIRAEFSHDGRRVITASEDGKARIWPVDPFAVALRVKPREFTPSEKIRYNLLDEEELQALKRVDELFENRPSKIDVIVELQGNSKNPPNDIALQYARMKGPDCDPKVLAIKLNQGSWETVRSPCGNRDSYLRAFRRIKASFEEVDDYEQDAGDYLNTMGAAQYRLGLYEEALSTLNHSCEINDGKGWPYDLAFLAMVHHGLGREEDALAALEKLRNRMLCTEWRADKVSRALLHEAENMILGCQTRIAIPELGREDLQEEFYWIVTRSYDSRSGDYRKPRIVYGISPGGDRRVPLYAPAALDKSEYIQSPAINTQGKIAFTVSSELMKGGIRPMYWGRIGESEMHPISNTYIDVPGENIQWIGEEDEILFGNQWSGIHRMDLDPGTADETVLTNNFFDDHIVIGSSGRVFFCNNFYRLPWLLWSLNPDDGRIRSWSPVGFPDGFKLCHFHISPDERHFAVIGHRKGDPPEIWMARIAGECKFAAVRPVVEGCELRFEAVAWSPDGQELAFVREGNLWSVKADGSGMRQLTSNESTLNIHGSWKPARQ